MNSFGADFPFEVETFQMQKLDNLTTRLAVSNFLNWDNIVSLMTASSPRASPFEAEVD